MDYKDEIEINCTCFYCRKGLNHPKMHIEYKQTSSLLLKIESLKKEDIIPLEYCILCGHTRQKL